MELKVYGTLAQIRKELADSLRRSRAFFASDGMRPFDRNRAAVSHSYYFLLGRFGIRCKPSYGNGNLQG